MPTATKKPVYVAVIKMDDAYAVVLTRDGTAVEGFSTEAVGTWLAAGVMTERLIVDGTR